MLWNLSHRFSRRALPLADRHYNRQKVGTPQFTPPGRCLVLLTADANALWVTSWPKYVLHEWPGLWICSCFRNESPHLASLLIQQAVAATRWRWSPEVSDMITFIDRDKVKPTRVRGKNVWGWTYLKAGFEVCGETKGGLLALRLQADRMPAPMPPIGAQTRLFEEVDCA